MHPLRVLRCKLPAALYFRQVTGAKSAFAERLCQYVRGSDGVLDGKVDAATDAMWGKGFRSPKDFIGDVFQGV